MRSKLVSSSCFTLERVRYAQVASNVRQEDRQRCDALSYYSEHAADGSAGELSAKLPLPPPLAALHDAIVADATALRAKVAELCDFLEVKFAV